MRWDREQLAWAAGFLDGEGNFRFNGVKRKDVSCGASVNISAAQVRREPLDRLQKVLGGKVHGPYLNKNQPYYVWACGSFEKSQAMIAAVWHFLSVPKQADSSNALRAYAVYKREHPGRWAKCA